MKKTDDIIGVIFDFNGTMFFDSEKHIKAWAFYVEELIGERPDMKEVSQYIVGKSPKEILEHFLGYEISDEMLSQLSSEKESIYRRLCLEDKENLKLAPGLEKFLDYLSSNNIKMTIASTANAANMNFYFECFDLYRWFDPEKIVYHDKRLRDKPYPDMYLVASKIINIPPEKCLVFEDSYVGITAALNAGVKHIVAVTGDNPNLSVNETSGIEKYIKDYLDLK